MFLDKQNQLSDSQALVATALSTNVIDLGAVDRNIGTGEPMAVVFNVEVAAADTGDEDYKFAIEVASDAAITTANIEIASIAFESTPAAPALDSALLVAGYTFALNVPLGGLDEAERYLAVRYTLAGAAPTVTVSAHLVPLNFVPKDVNYASGFTVNA